TFYFPSADVYQSRLFQPMEGGHAGHEEIFGGGGAASNLSGGLGMAFRQGGYMVESNSGHIGDTMDPRGGEDPTLYGYRASIEAARFSKHIAAQIYGAPPAHAYVYGGSGGGRRSPGCLEYGSDVYSGAMPYHAGGNIEPHGTRSRVRNDQPVHFGAMFNVQRLLGDKLAGVVDAMAPGGSGDPFAGLTVHEREELVSLYRLGFPRGDEFMIGQPFGQMWLWTSIADMLQESDADYFQKFWTTPGYVGHDTPEYLRDDLIDTTAKVKRVITVKELRENAEFADPATQAACFSAVFIAVLNGSLEMPLAVELDRPIEGYRVGTRLRIKTGKAAGRTLYAMNATDTIFFCDGAADVNLLRFEDVAVGDEIHLENRAFLAFCYYYRYHISDDPICNFLRIDGKPIYPQHEIPLASPLMGVPYCGQYQGKLLWVHATHDASLWPPQGQTYKRAVEQAQGPEGAANNFRIRWTQNAEHTPPILVPKQTNRAAPTWLITFQGLIEQSLKDLVDWVEQGTPPVGTNFSFTDGKVHLPATAEERGGIQPVLSVSANDAIRSEVKVGDAVQLRVTAEVPPSAGTIISVEWDFEGEGTFPFHHEIAGGQTVADLSTTFAYTQPGTYFPTARVTSHRDGEMGATWRKVENIASARVIVG
ncbi:MAG: hypothetical protein JWR77_1844, partial [Rhizorhabdus sp.]|nr:hypothetical protein [Rhizorhabdus sp.]